MIPAKIYPFTIPANGAYRLLSMGKYFKVLSATGSVVVTGDSFGTLGEVRPGQGLRDVPFTILTFTDTSGGNNDLEVLTADAAFVDDRVTGQVEVIDSAVKRTLSGQGFFASTYRAAAAGTFQYGQLWNPAGSVKRLRVDRLSCSLSAASGLSVSITGAQLAALGGVGKSRLSGSAGSNAQWRTEDNAADLIAAGALQEYLYLPAPNEVVDITPRYPIILLPGFGLTWRPNANNIAINVGIEFVEETA